MPTKIQGGLGIDKVQDGTVGMSSVDTELYGKITALTTINLGEAKTASGTFVDFDVPLGVKRVTVMFDGVSLSGSDHINIRIGDTSGFYNSGYSGIDSNHASATPTVRIVTTGFGVPLGNSINIISGIVDIHLINTSIHKWMSKGTGSFLNGNAIWDCSGSREITSVLDRIRITTVNGTDQFDAGTINISWEF